MPVKPSYLILAGAGAIVAVSGIRGWGIGNTFRSIISGQNPSTTAVVTDAITPANYGYGTGTAQTTSLTVGNATYSSPLDLQNLWTANGGPQDTATFAAMVAMAESGGNPNATSYNDVGGGTNVGLWQLETPGGVGSGYSVAQLQNPNLNAAITVKATNGGRNWSEWADPVVNTLPNGQYTPSS